MPHNIEDIVGAWRLIDWRIAYQNEKITRPFGADASGYILYSASGVMTASITCANRDLLGHANARQANDAKKASAFDTYFHYAGTWKIDGNDIHHTVEIALNPDMVGTTQIRRAEFDIAGGLQLSAYEPLRDGERRHHILQWKKDNK